MKKALVHLTDFEPSDFTYKYDLGISLPRSVLSHPKQKVYIYEIDDESSHKMAIGIDNNDSENIIAKENGQYYKVLEGVQGNMFLLLADLAPRLQKRSKKRSLDAASDTVSDGSCSDSPNVSDQLDH